MVNVTYFSLRHARWQEDEISYVFDDLMQDRTKHVCFNFFDYFLIREMFGIYF